MQEAIKQGQKPEEFLIHKVGSRKRTAAKKTRKRKARNPSALGGRLRVWSYRLTLAPWPCAEPHRPFLSGIESQDFPID
jgi:hypothetical protein